LQPVFFRTSDDETGLFDKLKTAKEFDRKLTDNNMTISFLRRGKEVITIGKDAKPTISKVTRSNDIEIDSIRQTSELKEELKTN